MNICSMKAIGITLFAALFLAGSAFAHKKCLSEETLQAQFRKWEAFIIAQENAALVHKSLDAVLDSSGPDDPNFYKNINVVLGLQHNQSMMDITIDSHHIIDNCGFVNAWAGLTALYKYRKRWMSEFLLYDYSDVDCLRTITVYAIGQNFNILNPSNSYPYPFTTQNSYSNDRFQVTLVEVPTCEGDHCEFNFRIKKVTQITEAVFPLPDGAVIVSPYTNPPGNIPPNPCPPIFPPRVCP